MNRNSGKDEMNNKTIREELEQYREADYQKFASSLIPGVPREYFLGVRLPNLRKIARKVAKGNVSVYLEQASDASFEEVMLQGMVIGYAKESLIDTLDFVDAFLPKIHNWSVCDSFCCSLKIARSYPKEMWDYLMKCMESNQEYTIRFAVVMMLNYYVNEDYIDEALLKLEQVRYESYYVKMAVAWAVSIYYINFPERTLQFIKQCRLDDFTYNKALQKICESRCVDNATRDVMRSMKRR